PTSNYNIGKPLPQVPLPTYFDEYAPSSTGSDTHPAYRLRVVTCARYSDFERGSVKTSGSPSVMATVCSKWAERLPSAVATVHLSGQMRVSARPAFTIGSMASTIPGRSIGFGWRAST